MPNPGKQSRTLATIVFTDAVGFSARMGQNEAGTVAIINRDLKFITAQCEAHGGRVLKNTGDGLLMCFSSAGDAIACALHVQEAFAKAVEARGTDHCLEHRIGIHIGDVYLTGTDVLGDGVNIAARLLSEAQPGGICFSQTVYDVVKNRLGVKATYLGPRELKNIREAVPVYQILVAAISKQQESAPTEATIAPASRSASTSALPGPRTLAISIGAGIVLLLAVGLFTMLRGRPDHAEIRQLPAATQPVPPVQVIAKVASEADSTELNRRAAEWVLQMDGTIRITAEAIQFRQIGKGGQLPQQPFRIRYVNLAGKPKVTDAGLENLAGLPYVEELHLYDNAERVTRLRFARGMTQLRVLNADYTLIADEDLAILRTFPHLQLLKLAGKQITDAGLRSLGDLPELQDVIIHQTRATDATIALLASKLRNLRTLDMAHTAITNTALEKLAQHPTLRMLNVSDNDIDGRGLAFLRTTPKLESLQFSRTRLTDKDLATFAGAFPSLTKLELDSLAITDAGLDSLVASLNFKAWRELLIRDAKVTTAGIALLKRANPNLQVIR